MWGKRRACSASCSRRGRRRPPAPCITYSRRSNMRGSTTWCRRRSEWGAARLAPVLTQHTQAGRLNGERMRANAIEAAEQCGILALPEIAEPRPLGAAVEGLDADRLVG